MLRCTTNRVVRDSNVLCYTIYNFPINAGIVNQHAIVADVVGVLAIDFEVVDGDWCREELFVEGSDAAKGVVGFLEAFFLAELVGESDLRGQESLLGKTWTILRFKES